MRRRQQHPNARKSEVDKMQKYEERQRWQQWYKRRRKRKSKITRQRNNKTVMNTKSHTKSHNKSNAGIKKVTEEFLSPILWGCL